MDIVLSVGVFRVSPRSMAREGSRARALTYRSTKTSVEIYIGGAANRAGGAPARGAIVNFDQDDVFLDGRRFRSAT
jgi:hypothetical protein